MHSMVDYVKPDLRQIASEVVRTLQQEGFEAYFAGGAVRDQIMGAAPADYDIATAARPEQVRRLFPRSEYVGAAFGVVMVRHHGRPMEVATFRSDGVYADGRRPESVSFTTAEHDAQRRDFTCNGLFYDPVAERLIDYVGGLQDIEGKILRAIGNPEQRFREDHLRMMRAVRFAARLNFSIEPATWRAMCAYAAKLREISRERVGQELRKMLIHTSRATAGRLLINSGLYETFWPEPENVNTTSAFPTLCALPETIAFPPALAALIRDLTVQHCPVPADAVRYIPALQASLVLSTDEADCVKWLLSSLSALANWRTMRLAAFKRTLAHNWSKDLLTLYAAEHREDQEVAPLMDIIAEVSKKPIAPVRYVNGGDLISMGVKPGPRFKFWLEELYDRQLENEFPDRHTALAAAWALIHQH
jgi:poly(A) polymerase